MWHYMLSRLLLHFPNPKLSLRLVSMEVDEMKIKMNKAPLSCLESLVATLVQKTREAELQQHIAKEGYGIKVMELSEMQEKIHYLETKCTEHEN